MKRLILAIFISLLMISCSRTPEPQPPAAIHSGLKIETLKTLPVDDYYEAVGTVQAKNSSVVAARVMGNIVALHVREGDTVRAGQTLRLGAWCSCSAMCRCRARAGPSARLAGRYPDRAAH